jgi:hypothetical protein
MIRLISLVLLLNAGCRIVSAEEQRAEAAPSNTCAIFLAVDSFLLDGKFDRAESELRSMLLDEGNQRYMDDILWRLAGVYHSRGLTDEGVMLFEALEQSGLGDLTGWKVSLLDLARRPAEALSMVSSNDVLLRMWLSRDIEDAPVPVIIPAPVSAAERFVRVSLAPLGTLTPSQITLAASDAVLIPGLNERLLAEIELRIRSGGNWVDSALLLLEDSSERTALEAERNAYLQVGDVGYWSGLLDMGDSAAGVAARVLVRIDPDGYAESWHAVDALVGDGDVSRAESLAANSGNAVFRTGAMLAIDLESGRNGAVLETCASIDSMAPDSLRARAALFRARALRSSRSWGQANAAYVEFATNWPQHPVSREAAYIAGKYYDSEQEWARAAEAYLTSLRSAGTWAGDERAHWRGGFCLYMSGQGYRGDSLWQEGVRKWRYGFWRDEMLFWRARYANRRGDSGSESRLLASLASEHPWEFYGMLASERLGREHEMRLSPTSILLAEDPLTLKASEMFSRGYGTLAIEMLRYARTGDPGRRSIALGLIGEHGQSISLLRSLDSRLREDAVSLLPDSLLCWYFPSPYVRLSDSVTDTMRLSSAFVQGIMREESYFNRWVVSSAGARGLIQLMPGTAYDVARWNGLPQLSEEEFFVPSNSILYGALYINRQLNNFEGQPFLFLAAYNAGPGNASRWVDMHGWDPLDPELYVEQITYRETRIYVKKVLRSVWIYERIRS